MITTNDPPPKGLEINQLAEETFTIRHRRTGMGCMNLFFIVWLSLWTLACISFTKPLFTGQSAPPIWVLMLLWSVEIGVACLLAYYLLARKSFHFDPQTLTIIIHVLNYKRKRTIPKDYIKKVLQIKDGGEDEDSFAAWKLEVEDEYGGAIKLLTRQPYEQSHWLGKVVAEWSGTEFTEAPND